MEPAAKSGSPKRATARAVLLILHALSATLRGLLPRPAHLTVVCHVPRGKRSVLLRRQLDVSHPQAHRGLGHADTLRDVPDRGAFLATHLPCKFAFACCHIGKLLA